MGESRYMSVITLPPCQKGRGRDILGGACMPAKSVSTVTCHHNL